jgi:hypothetical protein
MWPGLVGKEPGTDHPPIALDRMLDLTAAACVDGQRFDGVDLFLFHPHIDPDAGVDGIRRMADGIAARGLSVGSLVAPVWPGTVGDSAMGSIEQRARFIDAVRKACRIARILNEHGVRRHGVIRIDSATATKAAAKDPKKSIKRIAATFREAGMVAAGHGERLAAEGEVCWAGMHSWKAMVSLLESVDLPGTVGFQADLAHTYLYMLGVNSPKTALLEAPRNGRSHPRKAFDAAYAELTAALRPWTIDFHVAQSDGTVHGTGSHDRTGRHCPADDPNGRLDIPSCSRAWLEGAASRGIHHICWDGCMFPNALLEDQRTWNTVLRTMISVRNAIA